ncbi:MAG: hypothetical protein PHX10_03105 [Gallionellaceae bacterium]|nr:hypothetical protein [Gallionellaceae bacterium]
MRAKLPGKSAFGVMRDQQPVRCTGQRDIQHPGFFLNFDFAERHRTQVRDGNTVKLQAFTGMHGQQLDRVL